MRVLLINPHYPLTEMPSPPLGLAYVAAAFLDAGAEVRVLDLVVEAWNPVQFGELLRQFEPDLIGATAVTMTFDGACRVLAEAKRSRPTALTIVGGPHVTFDAEAALRAHPEIDLAVLGEGEATIAELCAALTAPSPLHAVAGLAFREGGSIRITDRRPSTCDVNRVSWPARHLLPMARYRALGLAVTMITSRGCPFQCIFCVGRKMSGAKVRYRDPVDVVDEMEALSRLGFYQINIADDLFTARKKHCFAICDEIVRRGLQVRWTAFSRANTINAALLERLKQAGCVHLSFGFESANAQILDTVQKRITTDQMVRAAELCREAGVPGHASFIAGLPGETAATIEETARFAERINSLGTLTGCHLLAPFPGTLVREEADRLGLRILSNDWSRYTANEAVVETTGASAELIERGAKQLEQLTADAFVAMSDRVKDGTATDAERLQMHRLRRMDVFYQMMMAQSLEQAGDSGTMTGSLAKDLQSLAAMVRQQAVVDPVHLSGVLSEGIGDGSIIYQADRGKVSWRWA